MTHDDVRDALPLFVVNADDPASRPALLQHLTDCDACRRELAAFRQATEGLAHAAPQIQPRPELRSRVLAAALRAPDAEPAAAPQRPSAVERPAELPSQFTGTSRGRWRDWMAAAAVLVAAAASIGLVQTRAELAELRTTLATWQERIADAERAARASDATLVAYRRQLDLMTADDALLVTLQGLPPATGAQARAFVSQSLNAILFTARELPALPPDRVYQLWAVAGGQAISAGTFTPDARGRGQIVAEVPTLTTRPDALAVTVEPQGGVPAPTGPKYLLGVPAN